MPKTKLAEAFASKDPPIDWLWGSVLERCKVKHYDIKQLAEVAGISYESMRKYANTTPWAWPKPIRDKICAALVLNINIKPELMEGEE